MLVGGVILPFVYFIHKRSKVDKSLIVFADMHHTSCPFSMKHLYDKLISDNRNVKTFFYDSKKVGNIKSLKNSISFMKLFSKAGCVVICDNFLPVSSCKKKKETKVIQLWHGCGAFKKFGFDTKGDIPEYYKGNVYKNYDLVPVSSPNSVDAFSSAMNLSKSVFKPYGVSRTDLYYNEDFLKKCRDDFYKYYPKAKGKKIILWAPTFRGNAGEPFVVGEAEISKLEEKLSDDYFFVKKLHPHIKSKYNDNSPFDTEFLLPVADLLITDYSSIFFDYLIFKKPIVFFTKDLDEFESERGFYLNFNDLPGRIVKNESDLMSGISEAIENNRYKAEEENFFNIYMSACDGEATKRIIDYINL